MSKHMKIIVKVPVPATTEPVERTANRIIAVEVYGLVVISNGLDIKRFIILKLYQMLLSRDKQQNNSCNDYRFNRHYKIII